MMKSELNEVQNNRGFYIKIEMTSETTKLKIN